MGRDCKREKKGKNWGEINIKHVAVQKVSQKNGARLMKKRAAKGTGARQKKPKEKEENV